MLTDFIRDGIDITIRYGEGNYDKAAFELLMDEDVSPVCSPELLQGSHPLRAPEDLRHHRLIHDNFCIGWSTWLQATGLYGIDHTSAVRFETAAYAVEAAVQGKGGLLGRSALVSADLAAGRLVRPFDLALKSRWNYYVVFRKARFGIGRSGPFATGCSAKRRRTHSVSKAWPTAVVPTKRRLPTSNTVYCVAWSVRWGRDPRAVTDFSSVLNIQAKADGLPFRYGALHCYNSWKPAELNDAVTVPSLRAGGHLDWRLQ